MTVVLRDLCSESSVVWMWIIKMMLKVNLFYCAAQSNKPLQMGILVFLLLPPFWSTIGGKAKSRGVLQVSKVTAYTELRTCYLAQSHSVNQMHIYSPKYHLAPSCKWSPSILVFLASKKKHQDRGEGVLCTLLQEKYFTCISKIHNSLLYSTRQKFH